MHPFRGQICGGSSSGKTYFTHKFLKNVQKLVTTPPDYILWFYGEIQPIYEEILKTVPNIQFIEGFPSNLESLLDPTKAGMIIIDDLLQELASDDRLKVHSSPFCACPTVCLSVGHLKTLEPRRLVRAMARLSYLLSEINIPRKNTYRKKPKEDLWVNRPRM